MLAPAIIGLFQLLPQQRSNITIPPPNNKNNFSNRIEVGQSFAGSLAGKINLKISSVIQTANSMILTELS
jgi:hypothetical protein